MQSLSNRKTLYISDLDGTLLNKSAELSEYTIKSLNDMIAKGLDFTVATARTIASSGMILAGLDLRIPIVLMNGVLIYDIHKRRYDQINALHPEIVAAITEILEAFNTTGLMYELCNGELRTYYESLEQKPVRDFVEERKTLYNKPFRHTGSFSDISPEHIIYFTLIDTYERLLPVHNALVSRPGLNMALYKDNYSPELWYLEMFSDKASKRNAVNYLRATNSYESIVGFGDNLNDLPMFEACDVRVAVETANPAVRAAADHICGANDSDGVVRWLENNVNKGPTNEPD